MAPNSDGDVRQPFNETNFQYRKEYVSQLKLEDKLAVFLWFDGCRNKLKSDNPDAFTGSGGSAENEGNGYLELMLNLTNDDLTKFSEITGTHVKIAFAQMARIKRRYAEMKRQQETPTNN